MRLVCIQVGDGTRVGWSALFSVTWGSECSIDLLDSPLEVMAEGITSEKIIEMLLGEIPSDKEFDCPKTDLASA